MRRPHVLVIATWYPSVGQPLVGSFFQEQAEVLAMAWDVRVLVPLVQSTRDYWRKKVPEHRMPLQPPAAFVAAARTSRLQSWARRLDSQVDALQRSLRGFAQAGWVPDVILAHTSAWAGVLATRVGAPARIPVVIVEHSGFYQYSTQQRNVIKQALGDATIVCAVSPALRRLMLAFDLPSSIEWAIVGNLVDESVFYPSKAPRASGRDVFRILAVANRSFRKDIRTLMEAVAVIRSKRPELSLQLRTVGDFLVGNTPSFSTLAADCGVDDILIRKASLGREEIATAMRESDLFVSSSISETFGIALAEALACGVPVVATRSGGAEFILGDDSPFLVEVRDPPGLAERILEVVDDRIPFDGLAAAQEIVERFGSVAYSRKMTEVLARAIGHRPWSAIVAEDSGPDRIQAQ